MSAGLAVVFLIVGGLWLVLMAVVIGGGAREAAQDHQAEMAELLAERERILAHQEWILKNGGR